MDSPEKKSSLREDFKDWGGHSSKKIGGNIETTRTVSLKHKIRAGDLGQKGKKTISATLGSKQGRMSLLRSRFNLGDTFSKSPTCTASLRKRKPKRGASKHSNTRTHFSNHFCNIVGVREIKEERGGKKTAARRM